MPSAPSSVAAACRLFLDVDVVRFIRYPLNAFLLALCRRLRSRVLCRSAERIVLAFVVIEDIV